MLRHCYHTQRRQRYKTMRIGLEQCENSPQDNDTSQYHGLSYITEWAYSFTFSEMIYCMIFAHIHTKLFIFSIVVSVNHFPAPLLLTVTSIWLDVKIYSYCVWFSWFCSWFLFCVIIYTETRKLGNITIVKGHMTIFNCSFYHYIILYYIILCYVVLYYIILSYIICPFSADIVAHF